ncbi:carboxymuconolactone decarboxylase family protein [Streptomyces mexicanus]|uniref:Carboxymuconolactone decarboxylase family protein n=1 Tax=Streptomyces mexicanus TaxID=178566 RepID=A0A7X1HXJ1_9ACTN|nr:NAD(P)-binding domain-containing protein [Streptomyces mexicanus]MBC2865020.1 carboxymuconolactone decarboxylase family protein [Streptomyces mexicanus]
MTDNDEADNLRAGVVGLGAIGGGVAVSMARCGRVPAVYDIRPDASANLAGVPDPLGSPAEVAKSSDVVMVAVVNAEQAREVIGGENGLLSAAHPGLVIVLQATVALPVVHELAALCAKSGVRFLDCGVTPGDRAAEHGMVAIVGGDTATVEAARPVLDDWAKKVVHCGPLGAGMATKIARNVITYGSWRAVHEAADLARAAGVDAARLAEVVDTADPEGRTLLQLLGMRGPDGHLPEAAGRKIEPLMTKDLDAARELAADLGLDVPLVDAARANVRATLDLDEKTDGKPASHPQQAVPSAPDELRRFGLAMMDAAYGPGFSNAMPREGGDPFTQATADYLFAQVWARPGLSVRDRRLLTLGVAATVGRADLIEIIANGGLVNEELTPDALREAVLHLAAYTGWCKATAVHAGVTAAINAHTPPQEQK